MRSQPHVEVTFVYLSSALNSFMPRPLEYISLDLVVVKMKLLRRYSCIHPFMTSYVETRSHRSPIFETSHCGGFCGGTENLQGPHQLDSSASTSCGQFNLENCAEDCTCVPDQMNLSVASLLSIFWGEATFSPLNFLGSSQQQPVFPVQHDANVLSSEGAFLNKIPAGFEQASVSFVRDNLAVIPGTWDSGGISKLVLLWLYSSTV